MVPTSPGKCWKFLKFEKIPGKPWNFAEILEKPKKSPGISLWLNSPKDSIDGKGGHTAPPFSKIPPFLEIQDVPTFHRSIRKTKELNNSFKQFAYNFYPQSILFWKNVYKSGEMQT